MAKMNTKVYYFQVFNVNESIRNFLLCYISKKIYCR